jgi:hypothetical protein
MNRTHSFSTSNGNSFTNKKLEEFINSLVLVLASHGGTIGVLIAILLFY